MLASMQLRKADGTFITTFPMIAPGPTDQFVIKNADGLEPVNAEVSISQYSPIDGGVIQAARLGTRNIVLTMGYRPDYKSSIDPIQTLRRELYKYFSPKRLIRLTFLNTDGLIMQIDGIVESLDPMIFSQDPEVQISIVCPDPNFSATDVVTLYGTTGTPRTLPGVGDAESGFIFDITVDRALNGIAIKVGDYDELNYSRSLLVGDRVRISTVRGSKSVYLFRDGTSTNDLGRIAGGSLSTGFDSYVPSFYARVSGDYALPYTLQFTPRYLGV